MFAYEKALVKNLEEDEHYSWEEVYAANRVSMACEEIAGNYSQEDELIDSVVEEYLRTVAHAAELSKAFARAEAEVCE